MVTISIQLPDQKAARLAELARQFNTTSEDLAAERILELLEEPNEDFRQLVRKVLDKNADLYRRLA
jgi:predicted transcriptional regulator